MKTLSLEASKRLQQYMPEKTEYMYSNSAYFKPRDGDNEYRVVGVKSYGKQFKKYTYYKTLTLSEAIDMLPGAWSILPSGDNKMVIWENETDRRLFQGETTLLAVEKMLLYLHKENLL